MDKENRMKKISFTTTEYQEPEIGHPPVEESLADEPMIIEFEEDMPTDIPEITPVSEAPEMGLEVGLVGPEVITFEEPMDETILESELMPSEEQVSEGLLHEIIGYEEGEEEKEDSDKSENQDGVYLPGSDVAYVEDPEPEAEPEKQSNWNDDRDVTHFMEYLQQGYPTGIPRHDGRSISGCERAYAYLNRLNNEVSEAVRKDTSHVLDMDYVEKARVNMMHDMRALKEHMGKLKKKLKTSTSSDASEDIISAGAEQVAGIEKEATVARVQMVMTPFERAISGILINSVVSAGHPFEDVYDFLKEKYSLTDREELAILQLVMDHGMPIFKDRGTIGKTPEKGKETESHGIDFIKNYFG